MSDGTNSETSEHEFNVLVDYRETQLLEILNSILPFPPKSVNLDIGDIHIVGDGVQLLFERKSASDLAASIKDHRYSEQKARILSTYPPHKCTYIIEGVGFGEQQLPKTLSKTQTISKSTLDGAMIHTLYRDRMHVITTANVACTAEFIKNVLSKCMANPHYFKATQQLQNIGDPTPDNQHPQTSTCQEYVATLKHKTKKIDNIDKATCYIMQLSQIPGVSYKIAKEIAAIYPSYTQLLSTLNSCDTDKEKLNILTGINMIAAKKAQKIIDFIL